MLISPGLVGRPAGLGRGKSSPTRDWNFLNGAFGTAGMAFSRAGDRAGTMIDYRHTLQRIQADELRMYGLRRVENLVADSDAPANQTVTLPGRGWYVLSFTGTGTVAYTGGASSSLVGTGATDRVSKAITSTTASLALTITGTVTDCQIEIVKEGTSIPSEYVSRGTLSAPFHGFGADGVKYFSNGDATFDPLQYAGLMIEQGAVNQCLYSELLSNAHWNKTDTTATAGQTSPAMDSTAFLLTDGTAGNASIASFNAQSAATNYTASVFLKRGNSDWVRFLYTNAATDAGIQVWVNLADQYLGTQSEFGTGDVLNATIEPFNDDWVRVTLTGLCATSSTTGALLIISADGDASNTRVPSATYYAWGFQLEAGLFATSYVPTTSAAVTRAADVASVTPVPWFNEAAGTVVVTASMRNGGPAIADGYLFALWNNTDGNNFHAGLISALTIKSVSVVGAVGVAYAEHPYINDSQYSPITLAYTYDGTSAASRVNGGAADTDAGDITPGSVTHLTIGRAGAEYANCVIHRIRYWDRKLSESELASLSFQIPMDTSPYVGLGAGPYFRRLGKYIIDHNPWNEALVGGPGNYESGVGMISAGADAVTAKITWSWPEGFGTDVKAYPSITVGKRPGSRRVSPGSGMPVDVTSISTMSQEFTPTFVRGNTYGGPMAECWLANTATPNIDFTAPPITYEIMVAIEAWDNYNQGGGAYVGELVIDGLTYRVSSFAVGWTFIVLTEVGVYNGGTHPGTINWKAIFDELISEGLITGTNYLVSCELGVEPGYGEGSAIFRDVSLTLT